eukprot:3931985-Rhodomonas_salina.1
MSPKKAFVRLEKGTLQLVGSVGQKEVVHGKSSRKAPTRARTAVTISINTKARSHPSQGILKPGNWNLVQITFRGHPCQRAITPIARGQERRGESHALAWVLSTFEAKNETRSKNGFET